MRVVRRTRGKNEERKAERIYGGVEVEAREGDIICLPRMALVEKLYSVDGKLKNMKKNHYSLAVSLQLMQKTQKLVRGKLKENDVLIKSLLEAAKTRNRGGGGQRRGPGEVTKRRRYKIRM